LCSRCDFLSQQNSITGNILLRLTLPPLLFVSAAPYFLPKTSRNVRQYLSNVEDAHFPELAAQHNEINRQLSSTFSSAMYRAEHLTEDARGLGSKITHSIEDSTGLKLGDALGRASHVKSDVMHEIEKRRTAEQVKTAAAVQEVGTAQVKPIGIITEEIPVAEVVAIKEAPAQPTPVLGQKKLV
jgi:organizing structure protein 2